MANRNVSRRTKFHDFKDANGKSISYAILRAILDESEEWIRTRLRQEKKVPDNLHTWVKKILSPGTKKITDLKERQERAETLIKEEKLREIKFKNERTEGQYLFAEDVQRELDGALIRLRTNLEAIPEAVADAMMTSRSREEAKQVLMEELERHMREVSNWQIELEAGEHGDA